MKEKDVYWWIEKNKGKLVKHGRYIDAKGLLFESFVPNLQPTKEDTKTFQPETAPLFLKGEICTIALIVEDHVIAIAMTLIMVIFIQKGARIGVKIHTMMRKTILTLELQKR